MFKGLQFKGLKRLGCLTLLLVSGCEEGNWNNPYPYEDPNANTLYTSFSERPKHLDPAQSYSAAEWPIICQIYEPPLQYHYLKRPYSLEPLTAVNVPDVQYIYEKGEIAYSEYTVHIKPGIYYQPHPAFAKGAEGNYLFHTLTPDQIKKYKVLSDFKETGTRELMAEDYVYQIKRFAEPSVSSPIFGFMSKYIVGLMELRAVLVKKNSFENELDLRSYTFEGATVLDKYTYRIRIKGLYPQFRFWLAMPFFVPVPWEVALFYAQPGLKKNNISLDWYPVGTGPFMLSENNPERRMTLLRNPNFRGETFPSEDGASNEGTGLSESSRSNESNLLSESSRVNESRTLSENILDNKKTGVLQDSGRPIPMLDRVVFTLERENIPFWNKFLQGYYDTSPIFADNFGSAIQINSLGDLTLTDPLREKGMRLQTSVSANVWGWVFNMHDPVVGGNSLRARNLRQALSLVFDVNEFVAIFLNGRGEKAYGPIPRDIFGFETQLQHSFEPLQNTSEYGSQDNSEDRPNERLDKVSKDKSKEINTKNDNSKKDNSKYEHKDKHTAILKAKKLLQDAGIPSGLTLYVDSPVSGEPNEIAMHDWLKEQFAKIGIRMIMRGTQFNRFQDKVRQGEAQIFFWGWNADYPDPENFLFLFYGPNGAAQFGGENTSNYANPEYDQLFEKMRLLSDGPERLQIIQQMIKILQVDAPWIWGFYPKSFILYQGWTRETKPGGMAQNTLKYFKIDPALRARQQALWNKPRLWPLIGMLGILIVLSIVLVYGYWRRQVRRILKR